MPILENMYSAGSGMSTGMVWVAISLMKYAASGFDNAKDGV